MPIRPENKSRYPANWKDISLRIRTQRAQNCCEWCGAENGQPNPRTGSKVVLTVAHLDHTPENCNEDNLAALCQACHLGYDRDRHTANRALNRHGEYVKGDGYKNQHKLF